MKFLEKLELWLFHKFKCTKLTLKSPEGIKMTVTKHYGYTVSGGHHLFRLHDYEDLVDFCEKGRLKTTYGSKLK